MPADFPAWDRVYAFFRRWRGKGLVAEFHDRLRDRVREASGRDPESTAGIIDAQSVKGAASVPVASRGFDGGKKVKGRKRHIVVDTLGLLLAVMVTAASVTDRGAGWTLLERLRLRRWRISLVWADGGYTGRLVDLARDVLRIALTVVRRIDDATGFVVLPKRWLVERTFARLMHSRRLVRDFFASAGCLAATCPGGGVGAVGVGPNTVLVRRACCPCMALVCPEQGAIPASGFSPAWCPLPMRSCRPVRVGDWLRDDARLLPGTAVADAVRVQRGELVPVLLEVGVGFPQGRVQERGVQLGHSSEGAVCAGGWGRRASPGGLGGAGAVGVQAPGGGGA
ncbi:IS5 family transposase [Streptomyces goshikiensis]|uniref:IS5 family transposase n=1 Tax=Streptomyces goshikiensis TaxID=1942 RepID=UPI0036A6E5CF